MNNGGKQKTSTEEAAAIGRFTSEQLMALRDIVRILRLLRAQRKALEQERTVSALYGTLPDPQTGSAEVNGDRLEERVVLGDGT